MESADFEEVLCSWSWWDCPRSGVALLNGEPYRFDCEFSELLDDYPAEFRLWPISEGQLEAEVAAWEQWADWRSRFDRGERVEPFEREPGFEEFRDRMKAYATPPADVMLAIPEWKLDPNRSFDRRVPQHLVRWTSAAR